MVRKYLHIGIQVLLATILLLIPAFINGYPFVSSDTGTYLHIAFTGDNPPDRPVFYGWFIRISSLGISLWGTAFVQSFLLAFLLFLFAFKFFPAFHRPWWITLLIAPLVVTTGISTFSGQIMPDIFVPIAFLSFLLLVLGKWEKQYHMLLIGVVFTGSTLMHPSILLVMTCGTILVWLWTLLRRVEFSRKLFLTVAVLVCWIAHITVNGLQTGEWTAGRGTTVFMAAKLNSYGLIKPFIDVHCPSNPSKLCECLNDAPQDFNEFIWNPNQPVDCLGGFEKARPTLQPVVHFYLSHPKYYDDYLWQTTKLSLRQLGSFDIGDGLWPYPDGQNVYWKVQFHLAREFDEYLAAKQQKQGWWPFETWSISQMVVVTICLILILLALLPSSFCAYRGLIIWFLTLIILNAIASATFSTLSHRFMARIVWMTPYLALLLYLPSLVKRLNHWVHIR